MIAVQPDGCKVYRIPLYLKKRDTSQQQRTATTQLNVAFNRTNTCEGLASVLTVISRHVHPDVAALTC